MECGLTESHSSSPQIDTYLLDFRPHLSITRSRRKSRAGYPGVNGRPWLRRPCWETPIANPSDSEESDEDDYSWYYQNPERYVWKPRKTRSHRKTAQRPAKLSLESPMDVPATKKYSLPSPTMPSPLLSPGSKLLWRDDFGFPELFQGVQKSQSQREPISPLTSNPPSSRSSSDAQPLSWVNTPSSSEESFDVVEKGSRSRGDSSARLRRQCAEWVGSWHSSPFFTSEPAEY